MLIGPFFYVGTDVLTHSGIVSDRMALLQGEYICGKVGSPVSHDSLYERLSLGVDEEDLPRGKVVYDPAKDEAVIRLDRCIMVHLQRILKEFDVVRYRVEIDDSYHCPSCIGL